MQNLIGTTIGSLQIVEKLGRGGMANVYKGYHPGLAVYRAVKVIRPDLSGIDGFEERFQREARAVAGLRHPNIVQMHDFGQHEDLFYMVMEFVEGEDLKGLIARQGAIRPFSEVIRIATELAAALGFAHERGVLHRDVKPDNVLLSKDGHVILADFGIAKMLASDETALTAAGTGIGTPNYMAPELAMGKTDTSAAQDLYAVGVVLYEMLTAQAPFAADTPLAVLQRVLHDPVKPPREFTPDIPDALQGVVLKAMAFKPEDRYPSADAFIEAANQSLLGLGPAPPARSPDAQAPTELVAEAESAGGQHRGLLLAGILAIVLIGALGTVAVFGWKWWTSRSTETQVERLLETVDDAGEAVASVGSSREGSAVDSLDSATSEAGAPGLEPASTADSRESAVAVEPETEPATTTGREAGDADQGEGQAPIEAARVVVEVASPPPSGGEGAARIPAASPREAEADTRLAQIDGGRRFAGSLSFGASAAGELDPEEVVEYEIGVRRPTYIYFDIVYMTRPALFTLFDEEGAEVFREGSDLGPFRLEKAGLYRLTIETEAEIPVQYEVQFLRVGG